MIPDLWLWFVAAGLIGLGAGAIVAGWIIT